MSQIKSNKTYIIGIAVALGVPLFCYLLVSKLSKNVIHPPRYYVMDSIATKTVDGLIHFDTVFHKVNNLSLINQLGEHIATDTNLKNKILVFDFFFTSCPTICPKLTANMAMLQKAFRKNPKTETNLDTIVQFLSITVNPINDTFQRLRTYSDKFGANPDHWWFLTGDKKIIYDFARKELFVTADTGSGGIDDFIHTDKIVLVDRNRHIRGYYSGLDSLEIRRCADDIVLLTLEKEKKNSK